MSRVRKTAALAAVVTLVPAGVALASVTRVTGGSTQVTVSAAAAKVLSDNHVTVTPVAPATAASQTFTFPIAGGALNAKLHGFIRQQGGLSVSNGTKTVTLRKLTIISTKHGATIDALVRGRVAHVCRRFGSHHLRLRCLVVTRPVTVRIARLTNVQVSSNNTATATVNVTAFSAAVVNRLAGKHVVTAGATLGTATISPTLKS
jgi:hypothetical protein